MAALPQEGPHGFLQRERPVDACVRSLLVRPDRQQIGELGEAENGYALDTIPVLIKNGRDLPIVAPD